MCKGFTRIRYVVIELHTGMMDGCYGNLNYAESARENLNQRYEGANFCVFKCLSDTSEFLVKFPPDHLFHANVRFNSKGEAFAVNEVIETLLNQ